MRLGAALVFVLAGVISLSAHVAVELAAHVVKHALGGHYVTVWAGIFLIAGIWEVARARRQKRCVSRKSARARVPKRIWSGSSRND